jgi:hypothetical protein
MSRSTAPSGCPPPRPRSLAERFRSANRPHDLGTPPEPARLGFLHGVGGRGGLTAEIAEDAEKRRVSWRWSVWCAGGRRAFDSMREATRGRAKAARRRKRGWGARGLARVRGGRLRAQGSGGTAPRVALVRTVGSGFGLEQGGLGGLVGTTVPGFCAGRGTATPTSGGGGQRGAHERDRRSPWCADSWHLWFLGGRFESNSRAIGCWRARFGVIWTGLGHLGSGASWRRDRIVRTTAPAALRVVWLWSGVVGE